VNLLLHHLIRRDRSILSEPTVDSLYIQLGAIRDHERAGDEY
jgi:hypothetical protein